MSSRDEYLREYRIKNKERSKLWYQENREKILLQVKLRSQDPIIKKEISDKGKERYLNNKEKYKELNRIGTLRQYGLTLQDYDYLYNKQEGRCAICSKPFTKTAHVDHNHTTGNTRALLCGPCNVGLGVYEKNKSLFEVYLEEYPQ